MGRSRKKAHRDKVSGWFEAAEFYGKLSELLDSLPPLQSKSVKMHYGLQGSEPQPVEVIALELGVSEDEVSRLIRQAIASMRSNEFLLSFADIVSWTDEDWMVPPGWRPPDVRGDQRR